MYNFTDSPLKNDEATAARLPGAGGRPAAGFPLPGLYHLAWDGLYGAMPP